MTFEEAKIELEKLAGDKFYAIKYEVRCFAPFDSVRNVEPDCTVYIDGDKHHSATTWAEALTKIKISQGIFPAVTSSDSPGEEVGGV